MIDGLISIKWRDQEIVKIANPGAQLRGGKVGGGLLCPFLKIKKVP